MNMEGKVTEVAGKHPVATNTHSLTRHPPPTVGMEKATEGLPDCLLKAPAAAEASATQQHLAQCQEARF